MRDTVTVGLKTSPQETPGQTCKQVNPWTNRQEQKDYMYSCLETITNRHSRQNKLLLLEPEIIIGLNLNTLN